MKGGWCILGRGGCLLVLHVRHRFWPVWLAAVLGLGIFVLGCPEIPRNCQPVGFQVVIVEGSLSDDPNCITG